ncbi:hypothetical protein AVM02_02445 [Brucella anthropi]|uniref:GNAT family N-acetyltransferase n=1 Tax=Brucella anthropi TaxID=529 RepID=UPI0039887F3D
MKRIDPRQLKESDFKLRALELDELDFIFPAVETFFKETQDWTYLTFDREKASRRLRDTVQFGYGRVLAGLGPGGLIVGYVILTYDDNFTVEKTAHVYSIYVLPDFRGTALPRMLIDAAATVAKFDGAVNLHAQALNHLPRGGKSFLNLLSKRGFEPYAGGACKRL